MLLLLLRTSFGATMVPSGPCYHGPYDYTAEQFFTLQNPSSCRFGRLTAVLRDRQGRWWSGFESTVSLAHQPFLRLYGSAYSFTLERISGSVRLDLVSILEILVRSVVRFFWRTNGCPPGGRGVVGRSHFQNPKSHIPEFQYRVAVRVGLKCLW